MKCATKPQTKECYKVEDPFDRDAIQKWAESVSSEFHIRFFVSQDGCLVHTTRGSIYAKAGDFIVKEEIAFSVLSPQRFHELYDMKADESLLTKTNCVTWKPL